MMAGGVSVRSRASLNGGKVLPLVVSADAKNASEGAESSADKNSGVSQKNIKMLMNTFGALLSRFVSSLSRRKGGKSASGRAGEKKEAEELRVAELDEKTAELRLNAAEKEADSETAGGKGSGADEKNKGSVKLKLLFALFLGIAYDILDIAVTFFTGGVSELLEFFVNVPFQFLFIWLLGGYGNVLGVVCSFVEFIPVVDSFPIYTLVAIFALYSFRKEQRGVVKGGEAEKSGKGVVKGGEAEKSGNKRQVNKFVFDMAGSNAGKKVIALVLAVVIVFGAYFISGERGAKFVGDTVKSVKAYFSEGGYKLSINKGRAFLENKIEKGIAYITKQKDIAVSGDIFAGEVENAKSRGLKLELDKIDYPFTTASESVFISGSLSGRALDSKMCGLIGETCGSLEDDKIFLSCFTGKNEKGDVRPAEISFSELEYSLASLSCVFNRQAWDFSVAGNRVVYVVADFNFLTAAYARKQFVSEVKLRELSRKGYVFEKFTPKYTPGPVSVKFLESFVNKEPLIAGEAALPVKVGVTVENTGEGDIAKFNKIVFVVPQNSKLVGCNAPFSSSDGGKLVLDSSNPFFLDYHNQNLKKGQTITFACDLLLNAEVLDANNEITVDFFEVMLNYEYKLRQMVNVKVTAQESVTPLDNLASFCPTTYCSCPGTDMVVGKGSSCGGVILQDIERECSALKIGEACNANPACVWKDANNRCWVKAGVE
jgi:hypothetical protein